MIGPRTCRSPRRNLPPGGEDELIKGLLEAPTEGSNTPTPSLPISWAQIPACAQAPALPSTKDFSNNSWKPIWGIRIRTRSHLPLRSKQSFESNCWRPNSPTYIMKILTWTAMVFVISVRTTLITPEPAGQTASHSPPFFSVGHLYSAGTNINVALREPQWHRSNSRISSEKNWKMIGLLLTASVVNSVETFSTKPSLC